MRSCFYTECYTVSLKVKHIRCITIDMDPTGDPTHGVYQLRP